MMVDRETDILIIGAGIVGLATALEATRRLPSLRVTIVEKENRVAAHQTGHNSGVIHSGVYYKTGSLKARNCVAGAASMKRFCQDHGVPYEECGKLIVATAPDELPRLEQLYHRGVANGVPGLRLLEPAAFREVEPHCVGLRAMQVPSTGIVDYTAVAQKYAELIGAAGGEIVFDTKVVALKNDGSASVVGVSSSFRPERSGNDGSAGVAGVSSSFRPERSGVEGPALCPGSESAGTFNHAPLGMTAVETKAGTVRARYVINCAGLYSDAVCRLAGVETDLEIIPFRGEYYEVRLERRSLIKALIYPVPDPRFPFLGVHFTRRVNGSVEAGPNALLALRREGYTGAGVDLTEATETLLYPGFWKMARKYWQMGMEEQYRSWVKSAFVKSLQKMVPELQEEDYAPGGSGVRAQAVDRNGNLVDDFHFVHSPGMIHVCNVPSPAATASLEIGREVIDMLQQRFDLKPQATTPVLG